MALFLVVKTVDVTETAQNGAKVVVSFDGGPEAPLKPTSERGVQEIPIPAGATKATIVVSRAPFVVVVQPLLISAGPPPTVRFDGAQALNVRQLAVATRGADFNLEVHVVLGELRDVTAQVRALATLSLDISKPRSVSRFSTPILNPAGVGPTLLAAKLVSVKPLGELFFAQRGTTPQLYAIVHPGFNNPKPQQLKVPLSYHLFFSPRIPADFQPPYPLGDDYLNLASRYLVLTRDDPSTKFKKMTLAYQNLADFPKNILVFPIAEGLPNDLQMGDLSSQAATLRLLQEVNYFVQRKRGVSYPTQPVGSVALSCFSFGVRFLDAVLASAKEPRFFDRHLRHVLLMDPWFNGANGRAEAESFAKRALTWFRGGQQSRTLRVYTQYEVWRQLFGPPFLALPGAKVTTAAGGAHEIDASAATLLLTPVDFWLPVFPELKKQTREDRSKIVHDLIPSFFIEHAITNSTFLP